VNLEFVNHASLILAYGAVQLLCDPWLSGTAFNEGWALLSASAFGVSDWKRITHIWYSHEHPDHFSPRCLAAVPESLRPGITVLFHESEDRKIARHCEGMGFAVRELGRGERVELGPDFAVRCSRWDHSDDSWLWVEAGGQRLLNLNDCMVNTPEDVARVKALVGEVDVLLTQFSIAAWDGNAEEVERRHGGGRTMLARTVMQCRELGARWLVPFASFVWFCHEENDYMNSGVVRVDEVADAVARETDTTPVVLYPGDSWEIGREHSNAEALDRYRADYRSLETRERCHVRSVELSELQELSRRFVARIDDGVPGWRLKLRLARMNARYQRQAHPGASGRLRAAVALAMLRPRPARVWIRDLERSALFDVRRGLVPASLAREDCDVTVSSDSLAYAFRFLWGGLSLQINGRFREHHPEGRLPLFDALWIADDLNRASGAEARPI
jgi:hypothetical protein